MPDHLNTPLPDNDVWELWVTMDTDDDCELEYLDKKYCYYNDDLKITARVKTLKEVQDIISKIEVVPGGKASELTREFLGDFLQFLEQEQEATHFCKSLNGNQKFCVMVDVIKQPVRYSIDINIDAAPDSNWLCAREVIADGKCIAMFTDQADAEAFVVMKKGVK
jgi:hypothetical protein